MGIVLAAADAAAKKGSSSTTFLLLIVLVFAGFYFLMIRPQRRRQQQAQQNQQNTATPGARVRTAAGMYATVTDVDGDDVILEVAPGVEVRYMKRAIVEVLAPGEPRPRKPSRTTTTDTTRTTLGTTTTHEDDRRRHDGAASAEGLADSHDGLARRQGQRVLSRRPA